MKNQKSKIKNQKRTAKSVNTSTFLFVVLLFALCSLHLPPVFADDSFRSITIVPPTIEKTLNPGDKTEGILKVINDTDTAITFNAQVQDFVVDDTQGTPNLLPPNTLSQKYSAAAWVGITPDTFTVQPHQRQELNYFIQVPANARPGGHYAAISYTPQKNLNVQGTGASVQTVIGSLLYLTIPGPITQQASVSQFTTNGFQEYGPVRLQTQIQNQGDIHIKPGGYITVQNTLTGKTYTVPLTSQNIFPETKRDYQNIFGTHWMFGRYKATLNATYTANNLPLTASLYVWIIPWKLILIIILILIAITLGIMYWKKNTTNQNSSATVDTNHQSTPNEK
jgi:hypothetical protein